MAASTGGVFTSLTTMEKVLVSLNGGEPLSVTRTVTPFVLGPCDSVGVQVNTPLLGLRLAPVGPVIRLKVIPLAGRSGSVTDIVSVRVLPSAIVWSLMAASTGGLFTSFTTTLKLLASLNAGEPLSVTRTVT